MKCAILRESTDTLQSRIGRDSHRISAQAQNRPRARVESCRILVREPFTLFYANMAIRTLETIAVYLLCAKKRFTCRFEEQARNILSGWSSIICRLRVIGACRHARRTYSSFRTFFESLGLANRTREARKEGFRVFRLRDFRQGRRGTAQRTSVQRSLSSNPPTAVLCSHQAL